MKLTITDLHLATIIESALSDLDIDITGDQWQIIQAHIAQLEQALQAQEQA